MVSHARKKCVWVHSRLFDYDGEIVQGVYSSVTSAKKLLGGEWVKDTDGLTYRGKLKGFHDQDVLEKMEIQ